MRRVRPQPGAPMGASWLLGAHTIGALTSGGSIPYSSSSPAIAAAGCIQINNNPIHSPGLVPPPPSPQCCYGGADGAQGSTLAAGFSPLLSPPPPAVAAEGHLFSARLWIPGPALGPVMSESLARPTRQGPCAATLSCSTEPAGGTPDLSGELYSAPIRTRAPDPIGSAPGHALWSVHARPARPCSWFILLYTWRPQYSPAIPLGRVITRAHISREI